MAKKELEGTSVLVCSVIAFPYVNSTTEAKAFEARRAAEEGGKEIDMVVNVGKVRSGEWNMGGRDSSGQQGSHRTRCNLKSYFRERWQVSLGKFLKCYRLLQVFRTRKSSSFARSVIYWRGFHQYFHWPWLCQAAKWRV